MMSGDEIRRIIREDEQAAEIRKKALQEIFSVQPTEIGLEAEILELRAEVERQRNEYNLFRHDAGAEIERLKAAYTWQDATTNPPNNDRLVLIQRTKGDLGQRITTGYYTGSYWWAFNDERQEHHPAYMVTNPVKFWCELPMKGGEGCQ